MPDCTIEFIVLRGSGDLSDCEITYMICILLSMNMSRREYILHITWSLKDSLLTVIKSIWKRMPMSGVQWVFSNTTRGERGMLGSYESHQHHQEETVKKKVRHFQNLRQRESFVWGLTQHFADADNVCCWTLCHPGLALPSDTLSGTTTSVLLYTARPLRV